MAGTKSNAEMGEIQLSKILLVKDWNREALGDIKGLVASIQEEGQLQPLLVRKAEKAGEVYLIDGQRRLAALRILKRKTGLVRYSDAKDDKHAFLQSMIANIERRDNTPYEIAYSFEMLVSYGYTNEHIGKACGKTAGYVSQHVTALRLAREDKELFSAFQKEKVALSFFRYAAKLDLKRDAKFFSKIIELALAGNSAQDIGERIGVYLDRQRQRDEEKANGASDAPAAKKGAAAHENKKAGPKFQLTNYKDPEVRKLMRRVPRDNIIARAEYCGSKLTGTVSQNKQRYYQGWLDALEYSMGLVEESE